MRFAVIACVLIAAATPLVITLCGCDPVSPAEINAEEVARPRPYVPPAPQPKVGEEYVCVVSICCNGHSRGPGRGTGIVGRPTPTRRCTCRWIEIPCNDFGIMGIAGVAEAEGEQIAEETGGELVGTELGTDEPEVVGRRRRPFVPRPQPRPQPQPQPRQELYGLVRLCCAVCCNDGKCGCHYDVDGRGNAGPTGVGPVGQEGPPDGGTFGPKRNPAGGGDRPDGGSPPGIERN